MFAPALPAVRESASKPAMPAVLQYAPSGAFPPRRQWSDLAVLLAALPAVVAPFVIFDWAESPLSVTIKTFRDWRQCQANSPNTWPWLMAVAVPFYLGIVFCAYKLRMLIRPRLTFAERRTLWGLAIGSSCCTTAFIAYVCLNSPPPPSDLIECIIPLFLLCSGAAALRLRRKRIEPGRLACLAISVAYVGGVSLPLCVLHSSDDIGWKLTLAAAIVIAAEFVTYIARPPRRC